MAGVWAHSPHSPVRSTFQRQPEAATQVRLRPPEPGASLLQQGLVEGLGRWGTGGPGGRAQGAGCTETGIHSPMCVWAMTSASRWAAPLPPLWVDEDEVVEVVEPWMAWLIQCSMLMLPWLEVGVPWESPCTEPSSSEPEEVSARQVTGEGLWRSWREQPRLPRRPAPSPGARTRQRSSLQCRNDPPKTPRVNRHGKVFDITVSGYGTRTHFLHQQFGRNHVCSLAHMPSVVAEGSMCSRC